MGHEFLEWANKSEAKELQLNQLLEPLVSPESLAVQRAGVLATEAIGHIYDALDNSTEFRGDVKQQIFEAIEAHINHVKAPA